MSARAGGREGGEGWMYGCEEERGKGEWAKGQGEVNMRERVRESDCTNTLTHIHSDCTCIHIHTHTHTHTNWQLLGKVFASGDAMPGATACQVPALRLDC